MNVPRYEVFEEENGRWYWEMQTGHARDGARALYLPVGFPTREEAEQNFHVFETSRSDDSGRKVLSRAVIDDLVRLAVDACPDCVGVEVASVRRHERDAEGCNWDLSWNDGSDVRACADGILEAVQALRAMCNIADER